MTLVWSEQGVSECPGCGAIVAVGVMSLCATCPIDGYYYVDLEGARGWYTSREAYERGDAPIPGGQRK